MISRRLYFFGTTLRAGLHGAIWTELSAVQLASFLFDPGI